ncbi:death-associated inhibitor of apoptosis 1-like [Culicoides brevitarsis]|uniref:death-associated inhibitor of apoptosis 1-like n=1 Tax=Culicoides brevitarsis TaxID=469753 RepID=UPI00307CBD3A
MSIKTKTKAVSVATKTIQLTKNELKQDDLNFNREHDRVLSFKDLSLNDISTDLMALTGLYYIAETQEIKCYFCKYILKNITKDEDIIKLHYKFSRGCPLMTRRRTANIPNDEIRLDLNLPPLIYDECGTGQSYASPFSYHETKFPQFQSLQERLKTFATWPKELKQEPEKLAESGLFYTKDGDKVKCFDCGLGLNKWEAEDEPWIEHAKYAKNCQYVKFVKGKDFTEQIKNNKVTKVRDNRNSEEMKILYENNLCKNCNEGLSEVINLPCNHDGLCSICAISQNKCFVCLTTIEGRVRLYYQ